MYYDPQLHEALLPYYQWKCAGAGSHPSWVNLLNILVVVGVHVCSTPSIHTDSTSFSHHGFQAAINAIQISLALLPALSGQISKKMIVLWVSARLLSSLRCFYNRCRCSTTSECMGHLRHPCTSMQIYDLDSKSTYNVKIYIEMEVIDYWSY